MNPLQKYLAFIIAGIALLLFFVSGIIVYALTKLGPLVAFVFGIITYLHSGKIIEYFTNDKDIKFIIGIIIGIIVIYIIIKFLTLILIPLWIALGLYLLVQSIIKSRWFE